MHPTGLKHRLARSLIPSYGLVNGRIREDTTLVESSSGSTAVSEAYFARMLGLPFITVVPRSTVQEKIDLIEFYGGTRHFVDRAEDMSPGGPGAPRLRLHRPLPRPVHFRRARDRPARQQQHRRGEGVPPGSRNGNRSSEVLQWCWRADLFCANT